MQIGPRGTGGSTQPEEDTVTTARDIMTDQAECVRSDQTLADAARAMRDLGVGALPI